MSIEQLTVLTVDSIATNRICSYCQLLSVTVKLLSSYCQEREEAKKGYCQVTVSS